MKKPTIEIIAHVSYASAFNDTGVEIAVKEKSESVEALIERIKGLYPKHVIKVTTKVEMPVIEDCDVDPETGEIITKKRNIAYRIFDSHTKNCSFRPLTASEVETMRLYSAGYMTGNIILGATAGILLGKSLLGMVTIGLSTSILVDISSLKLRKKFLRTKLVGSK